MRSGPLRLPNLTRLGLNGAAKMSAGESIPGLDDGIPIQSQYGCAAEKV